MIHNNSTTQKNVWFNCEVSVLWAIERPLEEGKETSSKKQWLARFIHSNTHNNSVDNTHRGNTGKESREELKSVHLLLNSSVPSWLCQDLNHQMMLCTVRPPHIYTYSKITRMHIKYLKYIFTFNNKISWDTFVKIITIKDYWSWIVFFVLRMFCYICLFLFCCATVFVCIVM